MLEMGQLETKHIKYSFIAQGFCQQVLTQATGKLTEKRIVTSFGLM
jgi:hypothetical protein